MNKKQQKEEKPLASVGWAGEEREKTVDEIVKESDEIVREDMQEQVAIAEKAPEPGFMTRGQIIQSEDGEIPADKVVAALESAGYVYVYNTKTGDRSVVSRNMLQYQLEKRHPEDGTPAFTTKKMPFSPPKGQYKCWLHPDDPNRERYDKYGLPVCTSSHLASPVEVELHMQKKHKQQYRIIQRENEKEAIKEEREFQRKILEQLAANTGVDASQPRNEKFICPTCGKEFESEAKLNGHRWVHDKEKNNSG